MDNGSEKKYDLLVCFSSIVSQIATLIALCNSGNDYSVLGWYIPTYLSAVLSLICFVNTSSKTNHEKFYRLLFVVSLAGQCTATILFYSESWCGINPAVCCICPAIALDIARCKNWNKLSSGKKI